MEDYHCDLAHKAKHEVISGEKSAVKRPAERKTVPKLGEL